MAKRRRGGYEPTPIEFRGGLDLTSPPFGSHRSPGACVFMQNYVVTDEGYRLVEGYQKFRSQSVPDGTSAPATSGNPIYAIAQGQFSGASRSGAISIEEILGSATVGVAADGTTPEGGLQVASVVFSTIDMRVEDPLSRLQTDPEIRASTTAFDPGMGDMDAPREFGVDIYAFRRQDSGDLGIYRAAVGFDNNWVVVPTDGVLANSLDPNDPDDAALLALIGTPTLTMPLASPSTQERVRWVSRSFAANSEPRLFFVTGAGPEFGLYEIQNLGEDVYVLRGIEIGTETISTEFSDDQKYPRFIEAHQSHLFLGYKGGSVIWSALGRPDNYSAVIGAGEVGFPNIGTQMTGMVRGFQNRLWIFGSQSIHQVEGSSAATFAVRPLTEEMGAAPDTMQLGETPLFYSNDGVRQIGVGGETDFSANSLSRRIRPYIRHLTRRRILATTSVILREKDQYRVYFDNGTAIVASLLNRPRGLEWEFSTLKYPKSVSVASNTPAPSDLRDQYLADRTLLALGREDSLGRPVMDDEPDGYVYIDGLSPSGGDIPETFDGTSIEAAFQLGLQSLRRAASVKKFNRMVLQAFADQSFNIGVSYGFGDTAAGVTRRLKNKFHTLLVPQSNKLWANRFGGEVPEDTLPEYDDERWSSGRWSKVPSPPTPTIVAAISTPGRGVTFDFLVNTKTRSDTHTPPHSLVGMIVYWKELRPAGKART